MDFDSATELRERDFNERDFNENIPRGLLQLSVDLGNILQYVLKTDIVLHVTGNDVKDIRCHKDILCIRSKWFSEKIRQEESSKDNLIEVNENIKILNAVLVYIYTGNLKFLESLCIPLIDLHNAAEKYGLTDLKKIVTDVIKSDNLLDKTKSIQFTWSVEVDQNNYISAVCPALQGFTLHGSDKWGLEIQPLVLGDETCVSEFYLTREVTNEAHNITHIIDISVHFINSSSSILLFSGQISAAEDGKYKIFVFSANSAQTESLSDTTITLSCELTMCAKVGDMENFHLKGIYKRHIHNELLTLSQDMRRMLKNERHADISVQRTGNKVWRLHSYMVYGRTRLPIALISKLGDVIDFNGEIWRSFIFYLYTGQSLYLDDHMRVIYNFFKTLRLPGPARRYEKILANNLSLNNAFGILCDSINNGSVDLMVCAAQYLARNSGLSSDPESWFRIAKDTTKKEIFQNRFN